MIVRLGAAALLATAGVTTVTLVGNRGGASTKHSAAAVAQDQAGAAGAGESDLAKMLPARLLDCKLGRISNFDPNKEQSPSEYIFDGVHSFRLFLPSIPARTTPPPDSTSPPEPVDPKTRILADPDGIASNAVGHPFDRVVDFWPQRVEMTAPVSDVAAKLVIIDQVSAAQNAATMFMTNANDAVTFDLKHLYYGRCAVSIGEAATASAN
ncbi:MAG: hypothetical protein J7498_01905 [Sphingobium sp.]|nr:hypothetical protein [Sphingobium sp.]